MSTPATEPPAVIALPAWQVMLVLIGVPALYIANSLLPWSIGLFQRHDHAFFLDFWVSIAMLHWGTVALIVMLLKRSGGHLADIGLDLSPLKVAAMVGIPVVVGLALTVFREAAASNYGSVSEPSAVLPATLGERLFWIFISLTAGICEEMFYRGFSIRMLQGRNVPTWLSVGLATLAFFFMHGLWAITLSFFLTIFIAGLLFSALFLWRRSLVPGVCLHALIDVVNIGAS
jgi:membrane protease YdiL (CAAX protease family)